MPHNEHSCQKLLHSILKFKAWSKNDVQIVTVSGNVTDPREDRMALIGSRNTF